MNRKIPLINRDISWLSFNARVLQEASDKDVPLLERLKFLGIFSNNQDEFFRVRVATLKRINKLGKKKALKIIGEDPSVLLSRIQTIVVEQQKKFELAYAEISKALAKEGIHFIDEKQLTNEQGDFVKKYFQNKVRPALVPVMFEKTRKFPSLKEDVIYLLVKMFKGKKRANSRFSLLEIPSKIIPRFLVLPSASATKNIILLDDVIRYCLKDIYQLFDFDNYEAFSVMLTRDAEMDFDNDMSKSHIEKIASGIKNRKKGEAVRLIYDGAINEELITLGAKLLKLRKEDSLTPGGRYHNFKDFMQLPDLGNSQLLEEALPPLEHPDLIGQRSILEVLRKKDVLITYPYQSFGHITDLLREAAIDSKVVSIKIMIYRVANKSNIVNALINAIRNGKQVTVIIEIQARFDEEANINWAEKLEEAGAKVIYGFSGLKVHSKLFLIGRKEGQKIRYYAHSGTGNFNESTSKIYSDFSLLTANKLITSDVEKFFNSFNYRLKIPQYKHLLVAPNGYRVFVNQLIDNEIKNSKKGLQAYIDLKVNSFCDEEMATKLYEASRAGVKIRLIVRGICSLVPGVKGVSENIEVISLVDRFLEHARVMIFCNRGQEKFYISSADFMERNFDRRVEVACPIYDKEIQLQLREIFEIQFKGNVKVRVLNGSLENKYRNRRKGKKFRAQIELYQYFKRKLA